jgi:hypothetical protein
MKNEQVERLVTAFERLVSAMEETNGIRQREFGKRYPERKEPRDAVKSRIPTAEDLIREIHGASGETVDQWLSLAEESEEWIGTREREYLARAQGAAGDGPHGGGVEAAESETGEPVERAADHADVQEG